MVFIGALIVVISLITILLCLLLISRRINKSIFRNINLTKYEVNFFFLDQNVTLRWNTTGITVAGTTNVVGSGSNQLYRPWGLALTYENTLYVADRFNHRVQKFIRGSLNGTTVAGQASATTCASYQCLNYPTSIALDDNDNLIIAEEGNNRVVLWKKDATIGELIVGTGTTSLFFICKFIPHIFG